MAIQKTTSAKVHAIRNRSVAVMPDRPANSGYTASAVKEAFVAPIVGSGDSTIPNDNYSDSILGELNRIVDEINAAMEGTSDSDQTLLTVAQNLIGAINELKAKITSAEGSSYGNMGTTASAIMEAIAELREKIAGNSYPTLSTTATTIMEAINELKQDCVEKSDTRYIVYGTDKSGNQINLPYSGNAEPNTIAYRYSNGRIRVADPENTSDATTRGYVDGKVTNINNALASKADLVDGKVPASQLPSYVDDVIEGYYNISDHKFYEEYSGGIYSEEITPESGKIYVDLLTNVQYRWGGSLYVEVSSSLALGETASTAYAGNKGKANADAIADLQTAVANRYTKSETDDAIAAATEPIPNAYIDALFA